MYLFIYLKKKELPKSTKDIKEKRQFAQCIFKKFTHGWHWSWSKRRNSGKLEKRVKKIIWQERLKQCILIKINF